MKPMTLQQYVALREYMVAQTWKEPLHMTGPQRARLRELRRHVKKLNSGCGRDTYLVRVRGLEPFVLKIAQNHSCYGNHLSGRRQNRTEAYIYTFSSDVKWLPRVFDWDDKDFRWIEVEYVNDVEVDWGDEGYTKKAKSLPRSAAVSKWARKTLISPYDVCPDDRFDHWGINSQGRPKLIDWGVSYVLNEKRTLDWCNPPREMVQ